MKRLTYLFALLTMLMTGVMNAGAQEKQPAFPEADGYAKYTTGGRGGKVYYVTRLDDCADDNLVPGTLRWALRTGDDSPRTILFAVNGTIYLKSKLKTNHPNVSILGQTAPGGGICITGFPLYINNRNFIVRHVRFRAGDVPDESLTGLDVENAEDVILDHCSMTWSMEECLTMFDCKRTTVQWCIIGEGLYNSKNSKGARAYATQWGGEQTTMHHTLITNSHSRSPRFNGVRKYDVQSTAKTHDYQVDSEFANNVIYNWSSYNAIYGGENNGMFDDEYNRVYMVGNYYRPGPSTKRGTTSRRYWVAASSGENSTGSTTQTGQWYLSGNKFETSSKWAPATTIWSDAELAKVNADNLYGYDDNNASRAMGYWSLTPSASLKAKSIMDESYYLAAKSELNAESADAAYAKVVQQAGASLPRYDEVDQRLLDEAAGKRDPQFIGSIGNSEYGIIDSPSNVTLTGGADDVVVDGVTYSYCPSTALKAGDRYAVDSDADGMPDAYEEANGFDKLNPADGAMVAANGYTNLENYLNAIASGTILNSTYQTSATYVEPGLAVRKEIINVSFSKGDAEGVAPEAVQIANGGVFAVPAANTSLYKEGYTMQGWTDGNTVYAFGKQYEGMFVDDVTLRPSFKQNIAGLDKRSDDVSLSWDFTSAAAPKLQGEGVYVCQAVVGGNSIDVALRYSNTNITIPACDGAVAEVAYADGTSQKVAATGETLTFEAAGSLKSVSITLPYSFDPSGIEFHSPQVAAGTNYELQYLTKVTDTGATSVPLTQPWMQWQGTQRVANRNCLDPVADNGTYYVASTESGYDASVKGTTIIGPIVNQKSSIVMYVKDAARIRTFVSGSCYDNGNSKDRVLLTAYPADGSDKIEGFNTHPLDKATLWSESFDVELDPDMSYMVVFSSLNGFDMMLGAVKIFDRSGATAKKGEGSMEWLWSGTVDAVGGGNPSKAFAASPATYPSATFSTSATANGGNTYVTLRAKAELGSECQESGMLQFTVTPAAGYRFKPKAISFSSYTPSGCSITVKAGADGATVVKDAEKIATAPETYTYNVDFPSSADPFVVRLYVQNMPKLKLLHIRDIVVSGEFDGSVVKHSFTTQVAPAGSGAVMQMPKGSSLAEGTKVNLTATPASGYDFTGWTNLAGDVVSTDAEFIYTIGTADEQLTANFSSFLDSPVFTEGAFQAEVHNADELKTALKGAAVSSAERFRIFLHNGVYDFGTTVMTSVPRNTSLIGESQDGVIIKNNPGLIPDNNNYQDKTPVLFIGEGQDNVYMQDLTLCAERDWIGKKSQGQCLALRQRSRQAAYKNVTMQGVQDTYYLNKAEGTAYFENCTVAGNVDYIYGDGTMWFEQCTMQHIGTGGYIVAPNTKPGYMGIVFSGCTVEAENSGFYLGRPWDDSPAATFIGTQFMKEPAAAGWAGMTSGLVVRFHEYGSINSTGQLIDLSQRSIAACNPAAGSDSPVLDNFDQYSVENVLAGWDAPALTVQLAAPKLYISSEENLLTWGAVEGAYAYAIVKNGSVIGFTQDCSYAVTDATATYTLRVANYMGGLGKASAAAIPGKASGIQTVTADGTLSGKAYNLSGQRVSPNARGIIIQNGRKVVK